MRHPLRVTLALALLGCAGKAAPPQAAPAPAPAGEAARMRAPTEAPIEPVAEARAFDAPDEDPWLVARGRIVGGPGVALPADAVVFVAARPVRPDGSLAPPIAVDRLEQLPADFVLDGDDLLVTQLPLPRTVVLRAFIDQDQDALTTQPGDRVGSQQVEVPALDVTLVIDAPR